MITKKAGDTLQPVIVFIDIPAATAIDPQAIDTVRLLLRRALTRDVAVVDELIVQDQARTDWSMDSAGSTLEVTWYEDADALLSPGLYDGEVWITDADDKVLKTPCDRPFRLRVKSSIAPAAS